jgi:hypothetical protein
MTKKESVGFFTKLALTGAITAGAALLAKHLIKSNYGDYLAFKTLC